jgi:hypothetical protein
MLSGFTIEQLLSGTSRSRSFARVRLHQAGALEAHDQRTAMTAVGDPEAPVMGRVGATSRNW